MLNIGMGEMAVILIAALLVMGPDRLPEFARTLGKFLREFRRQTDDVRGVVMREIYKLESETDGEGSRLLAPPRPTAQTIAPPAAAALTVVEGLANAAQPGADADPAKASAQTGASPPSAVPGTGGAASEAPGAASAATDAVPSAGATSEPGTAASVPVPATAEANVTYVDGIRIAPATGTVARGGARPGPTAAPPASNATPTSAADVPPSPPTSQS